MVKLLSSQLQRAHSYKLLAECYYPPDAKLIKMLNSLKKLDGGPYLEITKSIPEVEGIESLKIDYAGLFLGPYKLLAPPYGSVYLEDSRQVMGNSTVDVRKRYRKEGLNITLKQPPDHIAVELEFMYFLIFKEKEVSKSSNPKDRAGYQKKQKSFLETHLGRWVFEFTDNVIANAQTEFYKDLAGQTRLLVKEDLKNLIEK